MAVDQVAEPDTPGSADPGAERQEAARSADPARLQERRVPGTVAVFALGCTLGALASIYTVRTGSNLDYGDAMAHLTISGRILDSKAPGLQQLGTVWLPLPHLLLLPLVQNLFLFRTGIAACILGTLCLGIAAAALYRIMARLGFGIPARLVGLAVLLANPSLLYAFTTALTEPVLIAALLACLAGLAGWAFSERRLSGGELAVFAGIPAGAGVLTRYEAWALVISGSIFVAIVVLRRGQSVGRAVTFVLAFAAVPIASIGWWLAYNAAWYGNPLEFLTGNYSAAAFTEVFIQQGQLTTKGNPGLSLEIYGWALLETAGLTALALAGIGLLVTTARWGLSDRALLIWLAGTSSAFLLFSLAAGQHIMVNDVSLPTGAYNNRYVLSAVPWVALLVAALVHELRGLVRGAVVRPAVVAVAALLVGQNLWWAGDPGERMTVIEEAQSGRVAFAPVKEMATWLHTNYDGGGILMDESADKLAVSPVIGVPIQEYYNRATGDLFEEALADPQDHARWVVMHRVQVTNYATRSALDMVTAELADDPQFNADYRMVYSISDLGIYRRVSDPADPPFVERTP